MKKFNPEKELKRLHKSKTSTIRINELMIPALVVCILLVAILGVSFSSVITLKNSNSYVVKIEITNGQVESYSKNVLEGEFSDIILGNSNYGEIYCDNANFEYDSLTGVVSGYVNSNVSCYLNFTDDAKLEINVGLNSINDNYGTSSYYMADATNNYIMVGDNLFRIVRVNGDGSLRVILNDTILSSNFNNIDSVLSEWFNTYYLNKDYVVLGDYDITNYEEFDTSNLINLEGYKEAYVGLLSIREVSLITSDVSNSYLDTVNGIYTSNMCIDDAWAYRDGKLVSVTTDTVLSLKPVINISVSSLEGEGTVNNPYTF